MSPFMELINAADASLTTIEAHLDSLAFADRVAAVRHLSGGAQKRLFKLCERAFPLSLDELVPPALSDGQEVIFLGSNSLPLFTTLEKHLARKLGTVIGFNRQPFDWLTGPGYFTATPSKDRPGVLFDYTKVPERGLDNWPEARSNAQGFSRLVFMNLHDYCRRVSKDVVIAQATRLGKAMDTYFVMARAA